MAKSLRSKTKRTFRRVKRESGVFATADAARLQRLSSKLRSKIGTDKDGDVSLEAEEVEEIVEDEKGWLAFAIFGLLDPEDLAVF